MAMKIGINGTGVLARRLIRMIVDNMANTDLGVGQLNIVGVNEPYVQYDANVFVYLLKHDTVYGEWDATISTDGTDIHITTQDQREMSFPYYNVPYKSTGDGWGDIPWGEVGVDYVFDCVGAHEMGDAMQTHINAGARFVLCCSSGQRVNGMTYYVNGINSASYTKDQHIITIPDGDAIACAMIGSFLDEYCGVENGIINFIVSYTNLNNLQDSLVPEVEPPMGRAGAWNIIPCRSYAAPVAGKIVPMLNGRIIGKAYRCGTIAGSMLKFLLNAGKTFVNDDYNAVVKSKQAPTLEDAAQYELPCCKQTDGMLEVSSDTIGLPCVILNKNDIQQQGIVAVGCSYDAISIQAANALLMAVKITKTSN